MTRPRRPQWVFGAGEEPDPRFTLANERTFLAWIRTALALVVAGVATRSLAPGTAGVVGAAVLISLAVVVAAHSMLRWARTERALRLSRPLPAPSLAAVLAGGVTVAGAVVLALVVQ